MDNQISTSPEELFALIGEREFVKFKQGQEIQKLYAQIEEMSKEITKLKEEIKGLTRRPELVVEREKHG
jgi:hypothetical protein